MSKTFFEPYKDSPYYKGKMDIWYLFACNGLDLLNPNGVLCFIATNKKVKWYVSNKKYAKVTQKGVVRAKKKGIGHTVKVYAKAKDKSQKKAYCKVRIYK